MADSVVVGLCQIKADDGDVQMEPFQFWGSLTTEHLATFTNTSQTFCVCRKNGAIVDLQVPASDSTKIKFKVNGKDTGVVLLTAGLVSTVNNRMPTTIPIAGGAAMQILSAP